MTTSILNDLLLLRREPGIKIKEYLETIGVKVFDNIIGKYSENEYKNIVLYIVCAYSEDSPMIILRNDAKVENDTIGNYLDIPEYMRDLIINSQVREIRHAVTDYIVQFSGSLFKVYNFLKIQISDLDLDISNRAFTIKKTTQDKVTGENVTEELYDQKEHGKAVSEHIRLCKELNKLEKEIKAQSNYKGITEAKEYKFQNVDKKVSINDGISIENSRRIKLGMHG